MKRHTQQPGIRQWAGEDLLELQSEPLKALDGFFEEYGPCVIRGVHATPAENGLYDVSAGLVALSGTDAAGKDVFMVVPFAGAGNTPLPLYLTLARSVVTRPYADGEVRPVAYDFRAAASTVKPENVPFLELTAADDNRLVDVIQNAKHLFVTAAEREKLAAVEDEANKYVHPDSHPSSLIVFKDKETLQQKFDNGDFGGNLKVVYTFDADKTSTEVKADPADGQTDIRVTSYKSVYINDVLQYREKVPFRASDSNIYCASSYGDAQGYYHLLVNENRSILPRQIKTMIHQEGSGNKLEVTVRQYGHFFDFGTYEYVSYTPAGGSMGAIRLLAGKSTKKSRLIPDAWESPSQFSLYPEFYDEELGEAISGTFFLTVEKIDFEEYRITAMNIRLGDRAFGNFTLEETTMTGGMYKAITVEIRIPAERGGSSLYINQPAPAVE